jgi:hypothetical protein
MLLFALTKDKDTVSCAIFVFVAAFVCLALFCVLLTGQNYKSFLNIQAKKAK